MKAATYKVMCLTLAIGFAPASQLSQKSTYVPAAAVAPRQSSSLLDGTLHPLSEEKAFFYTVAISGHPEHFVDDYARSYDDGLENPSMQDEFERTRLRAAILEKLSLEVRKIDYREQFTFVCPVILGDYSYVAGGFPLQFDRDNGAFPAFGQFSGSTIFGVNPFIVGKPLNIKSIRWLLPMSESDGSSFVKGRAGRSVLMKLTYTVTRRRVLIGSRPYLAPQIDRVEVFGDDTLTEKLGVLGAARTVDENAGF